eukprot:2048340-Rhodomonas_salina.2
MGKDGEKRGRGRRKESTRPAAKGIGCGSACSDSSQEIDARIQDTRVPRLLLRKAKQLYISCMHHSSLFQDPGANSHAQRWWGGRVRKEMGTGKGNAQ